MSAWYNLNPSFRAAAMSMLYAPITVLLIVAHLDPVNGRPDSESNHLRELRQAEDKMNIGLHSRRKANGYLECRNFLKFRTAPKPKPLSNICKSWKDPCVPHTNLNSTGCGYGRRKFPAGNWTTTNIDLKAFNRHQKAFDKLNSYLTGNNSAGARMKLDVPIIQHWHEDQNNRVKRATMSFYVPEPYQSDPPEPLENSVTVNRRPELRVYYRAYGGNIADEGYYEQFDLLERALENERIIPKPHLKIKAQYTDAEDGGRQRQEAMLSELDLD